MTNKHLITLTPVGNYFFGSEGGFGDKNTEDAKADKDQLINYLVSGNNFPQQTTLLGMLRFELLRKKGLLAPKHNSKEAITLVGSSGFNGSETEFGIIRKLSPVFIKKAGNPLLPSRTLVQSENKEKNRQLNFTKSGVKNGNGSLLNNYDAKNHIDYEFANQSATVLHQLNGIFSYPSQIGIKKNYKGQTDDDAFFKQTFRRLKKGFAFAFYAEFVENAKLEFEKGIIAIGGDQSLFKFEFSEPLANTLFDIIDIENNDIISKATENETFEILLLNDCMVSNKIFDDPDLQFSVNDIQDFRYIKTNSATVHFSNLDIRGGLIKSIKAEMIARSAVLFVKGKKALNRITAYLENEENPAFKNIGYNYFKIKKIT